MDNLQNQINHYDTKGVQNDQGTFMSDKENMIKLSEKDFRINNNALLGAASKIFEIEAKMESND